MRRIFLCTLLFAGSISVFGQSNPRVAVIPFNPEGVSEQESRVFTELFETGLVNTGVFQVIEQNRIKEIVEAQKYSLEGCTDEACAVEFGRLLAADRIILGTVSSLGGRYIITAKIINVETGENIKADKVSAASIDGLAEETELLAFKLAGLTYTEGAEAKIAKEFGEVFITTDPSGADIYINGVKKGTSPELFSRVPLGTIRIVARKGNLYGEEMTDITEGTGEISIALEEMFGKLFVKADDPDLAFSGEYLKEQVERKIGEFRKLLDSGKKITAEQISEIEDLLGELKSADAAMAQVTASMDELIQEAYKNHFSRRLEASRDVADTMYRVTAEDVEELSALREEIDSVRFDFPALAEDAAHLYAMAEKKLTLQGLMEEKAALTQRIERSKRSRKGKAVGGIVTLGLGVVGGGLCGLFQYLAVGPYEEYLAATVTGDAVSYREQFRTMEALSIVSAGVGGASLGVSALLWATRPKEERPRRSPTRCR